jgi:hypothetical protein
MWRYLVIALVCAIFYLVIPGLGAFHVRTRWRSFRKLIIDSSRLPQITYNKLVRGDDGYLGAYRFFGSLEAMQGDDTVWIHDGKTSLSADLGGVHVYLLPSSSASENEGIVERNEEALPDEMPQRLPWSQVFNLPEGTPMYVSGPLFLNHGQGLFKTTDDHPLTLVIYDGETDSVLRRSIWGGRQRNEYWNNYTPASLIAGTIALLFCAYNFLQLTSATIPAALALGLSTTPLLPFLPPGLPLFLLYRYFWKRGRLNRAERDLLRLPMRYFDEVTTEGEVAALLPDGGKYVMRAFDRKEVALESMEEQKIRTTSLLEAKDESSRRCFVFSVETDDPMAECLMIPGNPLDLATLCVRRARLYEVLSFGAFGLCYAMNLICALVLFGLWIVR